MEEVYIKVQDLGESLKKHFRDKDLISVIELECLCEDLDAELEGLKEEYEDYQEEVNENYKPRRFNPYKEYGISERDFH